MWACNNREAGTFVILHINKYIRIFDFGVRATRRQVRNAYISHKHSKNSYSIFQTFFIFSFAFITPTKIWRNQWIIFLCKINYFQGSHILLVCATHEILIRLYKLDKAHDVKNNMRKLWLFWRADKSNISRVEKGPAIDAHKMYVCSGKEIHTTTGIWSHRLIVYHTRYRRAPPFQPVVVTEPIARVRINIHIHVAAGNIDIAALVYDWWNIYQWINFGDWREKARGQSWSFLCTD